MDKYKKLMNRRRKKWDEVADRHNLPRYYLDNLFIHLAGYIGPRLQAYYESVDSMPGDLTYKVWRAKLRRMIKAFKIIHKDSFPVDEKTHAEITEALADFGKYFRSLWL